MFLPFVGKTVHPAGNDCLKKQVFMLFLYNKKRGKSKGLFMRRCKLFRYLAWCAVLLLSGCTVMERDPNTPAKIGVILPLTGENGQYGKRILDGIRCGRAALERQPGAVLLPELLIGDSRGLPADIRAAALDMIHQGAAILIVGYNSAEALAVKSLAAEYQIPVITPNGSNDRITENNPYMFRATFSDHQQAKALADYAFFKRRMRRMAVMLNLEENAVYSRDLGRQTAQAFADCGGVVSAAVGFRETDKDFSAPVKLLLKEMPDVILVPAYSSSAGKIIKTLRASGFKGLILGGDSWNGTGLLANCGDPGDAAFSSAFAPDAPEVRQNAFPALFRELFGRTPGVYEMLGHDSMLLAAMGSRSTADSHEILEKMSRLRQVQGGAGAIYLKKDGSISRPIYINRVLYPNPAGPAKIAYELTIPPEREMDVEPKQTPW